MIFEDDVFYTLKPEGAPKDQRLWHSWYNKMTEPIALLALIVYPITVFKSLILSTFTNEIESNITDLYLFSMILIITFVIGYRLIQSLHLAKKDYSTLEFKFGDFLTLLMVAVFTSGSLIFLFSDHLKAILGAYAILAAFGCWHFRGLATRRIPADSRHHDLPIEERIQTQNTWVFGFIALDFAAAWLLIVLADTISRLWVCLLLVPVLPAILLNIVHSGELTDWPKLLINNRYLAPDKIATRLEAIAGVDDELVKKRGTVGALNAYRASFRSVTLRRARKREIDFVEDLYLRDFGYVLDGIFADANLSRHDLMHRMLRSSFGLGVFGYLRFYIIEIDSKPVGMVMPEFRAEPELYNLLDGLSLSVFLSRRIGRAGVRSVLRNVKAVRALQPRPDEKELRINYIAIVQQERRKGNAARIITLLRQAYIDSSTNGFRARTITAFVRDDNAASIALFEKAKFRREDIDVDPANDPTGGSGNGLIRFVFTAK